LTSFTHWYQIQGFDGAELPTTISSQAFALYLEAHTFIPGEKDAVRLSN